MILCGKALQLERKYEWSDSETIADKYNFSESENMYFAMMNEELIYGATLIMDYSIHVKTVRKLSKIDIIDYIPEGMTVVSTEPVGVYNSNNNTITFSGLTPTNDNETVVRLKLSKIISSSEEIQGKENTAHIRVTRASDGKSFSTIPTDPKVNEKDARIHSKMISIIPPFGENKAQSSSKIDNIIQNWKIILLTGSGIVIVLYFVIRKQRNK